jgi:TRAP-type C4-dicarboxylate transport system substrate-binding protein
MLPTLASLSLAAALASSGEPVVLKLGTLAPAGSPWHESLKDLARRWEEASGGRVRLRVYAGGTQGSEGDMLRKLAVGQLQAVSVSNVGLHDVVTEPQAFSTPLLFEGDEEAACTFRRVRPRLDEAAAARGLTVLQWTRIGRAAFFCNALHATPAHAAAAKTFAWDGDPASVKAWRAAGFHPVVLPSTDLIPALSTGMIDCAGQLPLYMLTTRAFERARYVLDLPWGYVLGATVLRRETWERIPADLRPALQAIAAEIAEKIDADARRLEVEALEAMTRAGAVVVKVDPQPWRAALERAWPVVRGEVVPAAFFDAVVEARDACRAGAPRALAAGEAGRADPAHPPGAPRR